MVTVGHGPPTRRTTAQQDELAVKAARLHFEDGLAHSHIADQLGIRSDRVARYLHRARQGLVGLRLDEIDAPAYDHVASRKLEAASGVRRVVVVRLRPKRYPSPAAVEASDESPDRAVNYAIAEAAAHFLWDRIRDGDGIAVGAGRAVRYTVEAMGSFAKARPCSFSELEIISLTGTPPVRRDPFDLDSDSIASQLGFFLDVPGPRVHRVDFRYVAMDPRSALSDDWSRRRVPDLAVFGLGVLDRRHHLIVADRTDPRLAPVRSLLDRLESEVLSSSCSAIIDVYDTFWVRHGALELRLEEIAIRLVDELNGMIVAMPRSKLDQAHEKVLVVGGELKYPGILAYLRQRGAIGLRATVLVTDSVTASRLIDDLEAEPITWT